MSADIAGGNLSPPPQPQLLRIPEAAERLATTRQTVYRLIRTGELSAIQVGSRIRVTVAEVEAFIERNRRPHTHS